MVNHYEVYETDETGSGIGTVMGEFVSLENAMDYVEMYRIRHPENSYIICGISYNRSDVQQGREIATWKPFPELAREIITERLEEFNSEIRELEGDYGV